MRAEISLHIVCETQGATHCEYAVREGDSVLAIGLSWREALAVIRTRLRRLDYVTATAAMREHQAQQAEILRADPMLRSGV